MYPLVRLTISTLAAARKSPLDVGGVSEVNFFCRPWDLDIFLEMNNGRILTLYDLGRFDLSIRTGLAKVLKKNRWGLAVAGSSARYRKRVRLFDRVTMRTRLVGADEKWFYIGQSMWVRGEPASSVLLRTCITSQGRAVPVAEVKAAMGRRDWAGTLPDWAVNWDKADNTRPWPPDP